MEWMRCDSCTGELGSAGTYYSLSTRDVVLSERYWSQLFQSSADLWTTSVTGEGRLRIFEDLVARMSAYPFPWSICESCSEYFFFDRDRARTHALDRTPPSGTGAVDASGCALFAALGWERATGHWPKIVHRPPARDSCDFCGKTMYEGEIEGFVPEPAYRRGRADGSIDDVPLCAARTDGENGWYSCYPCMSRHLAARDRAKARKARPARRRLSP